MAKLAARRGLALAWALVASAQHQELQTLSQRLLAVAHEMERKAQSATPADSGSCSGGGDCGPGGEDFASSLRERTAAWRLEQRRSVGVWQSTYEEMVNHTVEDDSGAYSGDGDRGPGGEDFASSLRERTAAWRLEQRRSVGVWQSMSKEMVNHMVEDVQAGCEDRAAQGFDTHEVNLREAIPKDVSGLFELALNGYSGYEPLQSVYSRNIEAANPVLKGLFLSKQQGARIDVTTQVSVRLSEVFAVVGAEVVKKLQRMGLNIQEQGQEDIVVSWV